MKKLLKSDIRRPSITSQEFEAVLELGVKEKVLEETGHTVGLDNVSISVEEGETFVSVSYTHLTLPTKA